MLGGGGRVTSHYGYPRKIIALLSKKSGSTHKSLQDRKKKQVAAEDQK